MTSRRAAAVLLALLVLAAVWSELVAVRARGHAEAGPVARDVEPATAALADALLDLEADCTRRAEQALARTAGVTDRAELFALLGAISTAPDAGLLLIDGDGRALAWAGATVPDGALRDAPPGRDATFLFATPFSHRLAVARQRADRSGTAVRAICHRPTEVRYPLRNRFLTPWSLRDRVVQEFGVADARILPAGSGEGVPLQAADGVELARLLVTPLSAESWLEGAARDLAQRRALLALAAAIVAVVLVWMHAGRLASRAAWMPDLVRGGVVLAARGALAIFPGARLLGEGPLTDPRSYAGELPAALGDSAATLLLTCGATATAAWLLARATASLRRPPVALHLALVAGTALIGRLLLSGLVGDVVTNSTVPLFPDDSLLPDAPGAALLCALFAAGITVAQMVAAAWRPGGGPALSPGGRWAALLVAAVLLSPMGSTSLPYGWTLVPVSVIGFGVALGAAATPGTDARGVALRAAVVPLGVALAVYAPLERELVQVLRLDVAAAAERRADALARGEPYQLERVLMEDVLDEVASSERLADALRRASAGGALPPDLAATLWADTSLAGAEGGSSVEILPLVGVGDYQRFSADLPPTAWLPDPRRFGPPTSRWSELLPGRGPENDGVWIVGETPVMLDEVRVGSVRITLEAKSPAIARLPDLEILAPPTGQSRELPPLTVTRCDPDGRIVETTDPRGGAALVDAALVSRVAGGSGPEWSEVTWAGRLRVSHVVQIPDRAGEGSGGAVVVSFDGGAARDLLIRGTKAALVGAILSVLALLVTIRLWAPGRRGAPLRLGHRLVLSYVLVAAVPLLVLAWVNRELVAQRARESAESQLREAVSLVQGILHERRIPELLLERSRGSGDTVDRAPPGDVLRSVAYGHGHHVNVFLEDRLVESSDQGLFDTELLPTRLPGGIYRDVILLGQPFRAATTTVGEDYAFDVGYAPLRDADRNVVGAVSVPLLHQRRFGRRELANAVTAVLGFYLAMLVVALAAGTWLARRLTAPLGDLTDATRRVAEGDLSRPVPPAGGDELGDVVEAFNSMMTDLAESRERLVRAEKEAAWRDMARQVAHEVKNPLTPMRLAAEHLRRARREGAEDFDEILEKSVDVIVRQTEALKRIATDFSDFARLPVRRREPVDVGQMVAEMLALYHGVPGLSVTTDLDPDAPRVLADPDEFRRVLVNLAGNAVEALAGREGTLAVTLASQQAGATVLLRFEDDGPGIPDDAKPHLFDPSFSTKTGGTGLGLAICKRAVEDLGGTIEIESRAGEGTTVTLRLPTSPGPAPPDGGPASDGTGGDGTGEGD